MYSERIVAPIANIDKPAITTLKLAVRPMTVIAVLANIVAPASDILTAV
jgi:hypothetical protein